MTYYDDGIMVFTPVTSSDVNHIVFRTMTTNNLLYMLRQQFIIDVESWFVVFLLIELFAGYVSKHYMQFWDYEV